jgi:hypothetical protein
MAVLIGRVCQLVGMAILPIGLYIGMFRGDVRTEVKLLAIGGCVYLIGWLLAKR